MKKFYSLITLFSLFVIKGIAQPVGWSYTQPYQITENSGNQVVNYQAKIIFDSQALISAGQMQANGADIRFGKDCAGNVLYNYWIESGLNTTTTTVWVKIDTLFASATRTFYMFYGNSSASSVSAVNGTFFGPMSSTDSVSSGGNGGVGNSQRGFRFSPTEDILCTDFGKREPTGTTRYITLFDFTTQAIITQTQVSGPAAQYSYSSIPSPVWLTTGTQYLLELYQGASDGYYFGVSSQIGQHMQYYDMRYCNSCSQNTFPTNVLGGYQYGYPDLWYYTKNNVTPAPTVAPIGVGGPLVLSAGPDFSYCPGGSETIGGTASGGAGTGYTYSWSPTNDLSATNTAIVTASPTVTTVYTLTVTDACGAMTSSSVTITVYSLPAVTANSTSAAVCTGGSVTLTGGGASSYTWDNSVTDGVSFVPASTTTYMVTGTDVNGCVNTATTTVTVNPLPTVTATSGASAVCIGSSTTVTAAGASTYLWDFGGTLTTETVSPAMATTYTVTGTDVNGCVNTATVFVDVNALPVVNLGSDVTQCGGTVVLDAQNVGSTYLWSNSATTQTVTVGGGNYSVAVTDANGCTSSDTIMVTINQNPTVDLGNDITQCGGSVTFDAGFPGSNYLWNTGATTQTISPSTSGQYYVDVTDMNGCAGSDTVNLTINPNPTVGFTLSTTVVCFDDGNLTLTGGTPAGGAYSGAGVSAGQFDPSTAGNGAQVITYSYTDVNGCSGTATQTITVNPCTAVGEIINSGDISVYPNPFSTVISIERKSGSEVTVTLFDAEGRIVMSKITTGTHIDLETSGIANGIYSMQLKDGSGIQTIKLVKNN